MPPTHPPPIFPIHHHSNLLTNNNIRARVPNTNRVVATSSRTASRRALPPRNMQLLGESDSRVVVGQLTGLFGLLVGERNAVVDVEDAVAAAGRPDGGRGLDAVLLGVDLAVEELAAADEGGAGGLLSVLLATFHSK